VYRSHDDRELNLSHGIWDNARNEWSGVGSFLTASHAEVYAQGMNKGCEISRNNERFLSRLLDDLKRAVSQLEEITTEKS
jgi:hypothetical protein